MPGLRIIPEELIRQMDVEVDSISIHRGIGGNLSNFVDDFEKSCRRLVRVVIPVRSPIRL